MRHSFPTLPTSLSVIMNVNKQQPVTNLRKYLDKVFQTPSCWSHCSCCLILHSDGCIGQIKRGWRLRRVTSLVSERGPGMLWCVSTATVWWHCLVTALSSSLLEKRLLHRGYSTFKVSTLTLTLAERNCPVGELLLLAMLGWQLWGYEQPCPPPSSGFSTYSAPLCQYLQVSSRRTMHLRINILSTS